MWCFWGAVVDYLDMMVHEEVFVVEGPLVLLLVVNI